MQHKHIPVDEFNLEKDLTKLNFSQHIAATTGSGDSKMKTINLETTTNCNQKLKHCFMVETSSIRKCW